MNFDCIKKGLQFVFYVESSCSNYIYEMLNYVGGKKGIY